MKIYIASRWRLDYRPIVRELRDWLVGRGYEVTSRWINVDRPYGEATQLVEDSRRDAHDVRRADWLIHLCPPNYGRSRGGNHCEFGMGMAWGHRLTHIGEKQHVFHELPQVEHFPTVAAFKQSELEMPEAMKI